MGAKALLKLNRSIRTGRKLGEEVQQKRYQFEAIKKATDLRTFFYEYSLFVGDVMSLPGVPNIKVVSTIRHNFLKAGRIMGDANAVANTIKKFNDGIQMSDFEGAGERYFRRFGGRVTGKVLMAVPGSNIISRGARSVLGANMQKEFDKRTKSFFRKDALGSEAAVRTYGRIDMRGLTRAGQIKKIVETVTEDVLRQAAPLTPVKTGKLKGSLRGEMNQVKVKGGGIPVGEAKIGGGDINYAMKIEYGEGPGFDVGAAHVKRYFPNTPTAAQVLRASKTNRRAVNKDTMKGAMMRRGATLAINRLRSSGIGEVISDTKNYEKFPDLARAVKQAVNTATIGLR